MAKYVLECACSRQLAVETGQAGESIACECGATVAVPTLRQLRQLPIASKVATTDGETTWGLRQSALTVSLLLAVVCLILAAASRYSERPVPKLDSAARTELVDQEVSRLTPLSAWRVWVESYQSLAGKGFEEFKHPAAGLMQQDLNLHRAIQKGLLAAAAVFALAATVLGLIGRGKAAA